MTRIRKAWAARPSWSDEGDIFYAPTASKARYRALLEWSDVFPDLTIMDIRVRRASYRDHELPAEHRLVAELSPVERHFIEHAFGSSSRSPGYRDHYCVGSIIEVPLLRLTFELGIFDGPYGRMDEFDNVSGWAGQFFYLTDLGKQVARSMLPEYPA